MGSPEVIAVLAAGGIVGIVLLKRSQTKAAPTCTDACKGMTGYALAACEAACLVSDNFGAIVDAGEALTYGGSGKYENKKYDDELARRKAVNASLNGPEAPPPRTNDIYGVDGVPSGEQQGYHEGDYFQDLDSVYMGPSTKGPFRYANGCEPYFGAPGWSKCKPGTQDMYRMAIDKIARDANWTRFGISYYDESRAKVLSVYETPAALDLAISRNQNPDGEGHHDPREPLNKDHFMTGASGDPMTRGPWVDPAGKIWWLIRGKRFSAPAGKVPLLIAARVTAHGFETQADRDAKVIAMSDDQAVSLIDVGSYDAGGGTGTTTTITCPPPAGFTWSTVPVGHWQRMRAGEKQNLGPCAGKSSSGTGAVKSHAATALGGIFGEIEP